MMEPMALGSPAGSPAQPQNSPIVGSSYLPGFLLGDNNTSRIGTMTPESHFSHAGPQTPSSPGSNYGSSEYRLSRQKAMFGNTSTQNISQLGTESCVGGPPTKSLYESLETRQSLSTSIHCHTPTHNQSISHNQSRFLAGGMASSPTSPFLDLPLNSTINEMSHGLLQWITVFGFPGSSLNTVLAHISSRVRIIDKHPAPQAQSNWLHLKCSSEQEAQRALVCNGNIVSGSIMIGVIPCTDEGVVMGFDKENRSKLNESMRLLATPVKSGSGVPGLNTPKTPIRIQNARPLVAGYNQQLSSQAVRSPDNLPHKTTGIVTKAMEYVFGW